MRIVAISTVRNEGDIVEAFVRHSASFVDTHLVVDHGSTDDTSTILDELAEEGIPVVIERDDRPGHFQAERMTRLMHVAVTDFAADWVVPLDADEFIVARSPRAFRGTLRRHAEPVLVRWRTYVPHPSDDPVEEVVVRRLRHRLDAEAESIMKVLVPKGVATGAALEQGSHDVEGGDRGWHVLDKVKLAHFPVRTVEQYAAKVAISTFQYLARGNRHGWAHHYIEPFEALSRGWSEFEAVFFDAVRSYGLRPGERFEGGLIDDPIKYRGGALRLTPPSRSSEPLRSILEYAAEISRRYGERVGESWSAPDVTSSEPGEGGAGRGA